MILDATGLVTNPSGNAPQNPSSVIGKAIHHTVTDVNGPATPDESATESQERAHISALDSNHLSLGYGGFGYHYIAFASGRAYYCGGGQRAHVKGRNHQLRGFAVAGTFTTTQPSEKHLSALRECLLDDLKLWPQRDIRGHNDWALPGEGTLCPGLLVPRDWEQLLAGELDEVLRAELRERRARLLVEHALLNDYNVGVSADGFAIEFRSVAGPRVVSLPIVSKPSWFDGLPEIPK